MIAEELAVIVYGVMAMVVALVLAVMAGSQLGLALLFLAAGAAYLFQMVQHDGMGSGLCPPPSLLMTLLLSSIALSCVSVLFSLIGW